MLLGVIRRPSLKRRSCPKAAARDASREQLSWGDWPHSVSLAGDRSGPRLTHIRSPDFGSLQDRLPLVAAGMQPEGSTPVWHAPRRQSITDMNRRNDDAKSDQD